MRQAALPLVLLAFVLAPGCGRRTAPPKPAVTAKTSVPLPEWAPKNPSPGFLHAAKVLKPMPPETLVSAGEGDLALRAFLEKFARTWPAIYEVFGSLSDAQIAQFTRTKKVLIPVRDLTAEQRKALENWLDTFRQAMVGVKDLNDYRVFLYRNGAKQDLSNVRVGFDRPEGSPVHLRFMVRQKDNTEKSLGLTFAYL